MVILPWDVSGPTIWCRAQPELKTHSTTLAARALSWAGLPDRVFVLRAGCPVRIDDGARR